MQTTERAMGGGATVRRAMRAVVALILAYPVAVFGSVPESRPGQRDECVAGHEVRPSRPRPVAATPGAFDAPVPSPGPSSAGSSAAGTPRRVTLKRTGKVKLQPEAVRRLQGTQLPGYFVLKDGHLVVKPGYSLYLNSGGKRALVARKAPRGMTPVGPQDILHPITGDEPEITIQPFQVWSRGLLGWKLIITYCSCGGNTSASAGDGCAVWQNTQNGDVSCQGSCTGGNQGRSCSFTSLVVDLWNGEVGTEL